MESLWARFQQHFLRYDDLGFAIDISRMRFGDDFFEKMQPQAQKAVFSRAPFDISNVFGPSFNPLQFLSGFLDIFSGFRTHRSAYPMP